LQPACVESPKKVAPSSERGLDWFAFFVADVQTGFGPFLSVYLTTQKWTQVDIGLVLSIGSLVGLLCQAPGGWIVDQAASKRRAAAFALLGIGTSAVLIAAAPLFATMVFAKVLHVAASAVLGPAVAAITLGLVGHARVALRLGRNARFAAAGNGLAAGLMGACGYFISAQSVFIVTAGLVVPAVLALRRIRPADIDPLEADGLSRRCETGRRPAGLAAFLRGPTLLILALSILLFHLGNAAMLPLVGSGVTMHSGRWATALVAACVIAPQLVLAAISPTVGQWANGWGRRPLLLIGFAALPLRGVLLASTNNPYMIVAVQMLDGISGGVMGVLIPLALADITRGTGHFNLSQGIIGTATGIGATLSTIAAGYLADHSGTAAAFLGLAAIGGLGFALLALFMPETRPSPRPAGLP
jgi:MFS family permease